MSKSAPPVAAPVVTIYKNGDNHFHGKKLVVNRKHIRNFENFLDKVTQDTRAGVAIRKIHTPNHGTKVLSLEKIENGASYVAAGVERFRRIEYGNIVDPHTSKSMSLPINKPVFRHKVVASARYKKEALAEPLRNRIIFVYRNGEEKTQPMKLLLDKRTLQNMDTLLQYISDKVRLTAGAVKSLYHLDSGIKVTDVKEMITNMEYVAVGAGKHFVKVKYASNNFNTTPRKNLQHDKYISPKHKPVGIPNSNIKSKNVKNESHQPEEYENDHASYEVFKDIFDSSAAKFEDIRKETTFSGKKKSSFSENNLSNEVNDVDFSVEDNSQAEVAEKNSPHTSPTGQKSTNDFLQELLTEVTDNKNEEKLDESVIKFDDEHSGTPEVTSPIKDEDRDSVISEFTGDEILRTPPVASPIKIKDEESASDKIVDNELSGTPPVSFSPTSNEDDDGKSKEQSLSLFKASGNQKESGDQIREGTETNVEKLIDMVPATEVDEEINVENDKTNTGV